MARGCDEAAANFLSSLHRSTIRNAKHAEISNTLALLGGEFRTRYEDAVNSSVGEEGIEKLGMTVGKRDQSAHQDPPNITFGELEEAYEIAVNVVDAVELSLS